jgi:poly-gamma-glutamate synthesis protein (capsule biosynthesis protein)
VTVGDAIAATIAEPFDLTRELPVRVACFALDDGGTLLALQLHHALGDGRASFFFTAHLFALWRAELGQEGQAGPANAPPLAQPALSDRRALLAVAQSPQSALRLRDPARRILAARGAPLVRASDDVGRPIVRSFTIPLPSGLSGAVRRDLFYGALLAGLRAVLAGGDLPIRLRIPVDLRPLFQIGATLENACSAIPIEIPRAWLGDLPSARAQTVAAIAAATDGGVALGVLLETMLVARLATRAMLRDHLRPDMIAPRRADLRRRPFAVPGVGPPMTIPPKTIRYEDGAWPLWRLDKNLRYLAKSLVHRATPWTAEDREAAEAAAGYVASRSWSSLAAPSAAPPLRALSGGDLMWIRDGFERPFSPAVAAAIAEADVAFANLETPIDGARPVPRFTYETLHYNAPATFLEPWRATTTVLSLANNHALDQNISGLAATRAAVLAAGLVPVGGVAASEAQGSVTVDDWTVAASAFTYGVNGDGAIPPGIPVARLAEITGKAHELVGDRGYGRPKTPALRVVLAHWGYEYEYWPTAAQREAADSLIAAGADVIVGSSPHVLQPLEIVSVNGADPACPRQVLRPGAPPSLALILWSLGNLTTIMPTTACQVGALVTVDFSRTNAGGLAIDALRVKYAPTPELKAFFADMAAEEGGHYRLAEADLKALGASPTDGRDRLEPIAEFHRAWLASTNPADWLGALYVLENVASALAADIPPHLVRLGLTKAEARFVLTHLSVDDAHGRKTSEFAGYYPADALLPAAERAARFWIDLHQAAFAG